MATPISLRRRLDRKLPRAVKAARQWFRVLVRGGRPRTRVIFVVGSQRSGTRLPLQVMDLSSDIATFSEGTSPYFANALLQPLDRIDAVLRRSPAPVVVLKPICETHRVIELLDRFQGSKGIWIFRHYQDTVNSASLKWRSGRSSLRQLAAGDLEAAGWRAGGLTPEKLQLVKCLYRDDMSLHEANAVMWYLRNDLFFDLNAYTRPDILLVRYEDLVEDPQRYVARLFDFVGTTVPSRFNEGVRRSRKSQRSFPEISSDIRILCERLHEKLLAHYRNEAMDEVGRQVPRARASRALAQ